MRRFDVVPITSEFCENTNVIITSLCYIPIIGYIYAGTNLGDIILYKYEDLERRNTKDKNLFTFDINRERIRCNEKCLRIRNISQKCKRIDKLFPIISYDTIVNEDVENKIHIGGIILCICEGNLFYLDYRLKGKITLLNRGVSAISIWKDSYNINAFQTKFCIATAKKKIIFYNTCILGDLFDVEELKEEEIKNMKRRNIDMNESESNNINKKKEVFVNSNTGINSWFGFSNQSNFQDLNNNKNKDEQIKNIEFVKVDEIQIPGRIASFSEGISNIEWCDNWICFVISNTYFIMNIDNQDISDILSLDQLGNYFQPQIIILPEQEFMLTCQDNLGAFFSFNTLQPSPKSMIQWPCEGLIGVVLSSPYLLGGTKSGLIQIYSLANNDHLNSNYKNDLNLEINDTKYNNGRKYSNKNQFCVQTLQLDDEITCISTGSTCEEIFLNSSNVLTAPLGPLVLVSTRTKIYLLTPIPIEESIFELVNRNQGKQAISLLRSYCNTNDLLYNSLLFRTRCLVGWFEFKNLQFEKAFECFEQAHIDPRVLLILFWKNLIPIEFNLDLSQDNEMDIYEYAKLPWNNSKGNLSEDLTPDVKFHESLLKSLLRIKNERKLPTHLNQFIQNLSLNNLDLHNSQFIINAESNSSRIEEYIYIANRSLKLFLLNERDRYVYVNNLDNRKEDNSSEKSKLFYSTGKIMDIAFINLIIDECNNKISNRSDISFNNQIILSLLEIDSKESVNLESENDIKTFNNKKSFILSEFEVEKHEEFLINHNRFDILAILLSHKSSYLRSLEILENILNSSNQNLLDPFINEESGYINIYSIIYNILIHMCNSETTPIHIQANLLKRYSRFILDKFDKYSIDYLLTLKPVDKYPLTIDEIINLFNYMPKPISNKLIKSYLEKIIYKQENIELKHKINLIEIYISDISSNQEISEDNLYSTFEYLFTDKYQPSRLVIMLEELENFDAEILIKHIHLDNSHQYKVHNQIIIEYILILFRSNKHVEALKFIIDVLQNIQLAEIYAMAWNFHDKYAVIETDSNDDSQIEVNKPLNNFNEATYSNNLIYNRVVLFTEFKLWRNFVEEYSQNVNYIQEQFHGNLDVNSWLDILDLSQNELSFVSPEFTNCEFNETTYKKLLNKLIHSDLSHKNNPYINQSKKYTDGLISLIRILVYSWKFHSEESNREYDTQNQEIIQLNLEKAEKYQSAVFYILNKYSSHADLSISKVLQIIPDEWPLMKIVDFLKNSLVTSIHQNITSSISMNLSAISYLRLYEKWSTCRSNHIIITQDMICHVCSLKLGNKQCALYPDGTCVHTHCLSNEYYSNIEK